MTCGEFHNLIQDRLDHRALELDDPVLAAHARDCPDCQAALVQYHQLVQRLALLAPPRPPDGLVDRVVEAVGARRRSTRWARAVPWAAVPVAAAAALWLVVALLPRRPPVHPAEPSGTAVVEPDEALGPPAVDESIQQAGEAVWDLAQHTANDVRRTGAILIASAAAPRQGAGRAAPRPRAPGLPESLPARREARPLAATARNAFGYLWQDEEILADGNGGR